jgi:hypothetical protein
MCPEGMTFLLNIVMFLMRMPKEVRLGQLVHRKNDDDSAIWIKDADDDFEKMNKLSSLYPEKIEVIVFFLIELLYIFVVR